MNDSYSSVRDHTVRRWQLVAATLLILGLTSTLSQILGRAVFSSDTPLASGEDGWSSGGLVALVGAAFVAFTCKTWDDLKARLGILVVVVAGLSLLVSFLHRTTSNPYCEAVKKDQTVLNSYGSKRTDAQFTRYAKVANAVGKTAPSAAKKDWTRLAAVTTAVVKAQNTAGIKLEEMRDADKVAAVDAGNLAKLNEAYDTFSSTTKKQGKAVVDNVKTECDITLQ